MIRPNLLLASAAIVISSQKALADQCMWVSKPAAQKAVKLLQSADRLISYCELCGDTAMTEKLIQNVSLKPAASPDAKYFEVWVNDAVYDLAYVFVPVPSERNKYENLAKLAGCKTTGVSAFITYPQERPPESWAGTYKSRQVTLILEQPTAGPWYHAQLSIRAKSNGNDRIEVAAQADKNGDSIQFGTPLTGCRFVVQKSAANIVKISSESGCGVFGDAIAGNYMKEKVD